MKKELLSVVSENDTITVTTCRPLSQEEADELVNAIADTVRMLPGDMYSVTAEIAGLLHAATTAVSGEPEEEYDAYVKLTKRMMRRNNASDRRIHTTKIIAIYPKKDKS